MGILNITPDSFYEGSRFQDASSIVQKARQMVIDGADILDIGGYSTRPGADVIPVDTESRVVCDAIKAIRTEGIETPISVDTFRSEIAREAVAAGADLINDVGCGVLDSAMFETVAELKVPYILMHNRANPKEMNDHTTYKHVVGDVIQELSAKLQVLRSLGVSDVIIDPGFGFSKTVEQNFALLRGMEMLKILDCPILAGLSRKSLVWKTLNTDPSGALNGTTVLNTMALVNGSNILRVHDVREAKECINLYEKVIN